MKYKVVYSRRFVKSLKRVRNYPGFKENKLILIIELLSSGVQIPDQFHDHSLSGDMADYRECHLAPDILLIYEVNEGVLTLTLINIGKHSQLFK